MKSNVLWFAGFLALAAMLTGCPDPSSGSETSRFTVTFDSRGGTEIAPLEISGGETIPVPDPAPVKEGYLFEGWRTGSETGALWVFETDTVTADIILSAGWNSYSWLVTFDSQGADTVAVPGSQTVDSPATTLASLPAAPVKPGSHFAGWFTGPDGSGSAFTENTPVTENMTLYACWSVIPVFTVSFDTDGGTAIEPQLVIDGQMATAPDDPEKAGFLFDGWFTDTTWSDPWDFGTDTVGSDMSLAARWLADNMTVFAGDPAFGKIGTAVTLEGFAEEYDSALWIQTGGPAVDNWSTSGLTLSFDIPSSVGNFTDLTFRLTVTNKARSLDSDVVITAVIYSKIYRAGTFDGTPPHQTQWKTDWTAGDAMGSNAWSPGYWFSYDDSLATSGGGIYGDSTVSPKPVEEGSLHTEGFKGNCLRITYTHGSGAYPYPMVGFGIKFADNPDPDYKHPFDLSETDGVVFRTRGNSPRGIKVSLLSPLYDSWGTYDAPYTTAVDWALQSFDWTDFQFPPASWNPGTSFTIEQILAKGAGIQFQTSSQTKGEAGVIYIDEVYVFEY
jgi:uncharacterized repeat protein (TIGR02543 family)